jgi:hypothetical protein
MNQNAGSNRKTFCNFSIDAKKLLDELAVSTKGVRRARMRDITGIQDHNLVGDVQGKFDVLLDENDTETAFAKASQNGGICGARPSDGSSNK